ncbi:hypothetical protein [Paenilisteria rocourtiae]|uniref:Uncharacterized protein n=1 Tax=Listeria rocourtiae TaxID=647910 RepID=A0A4R6ZN89_9LIST|nr:hypothetical protein [Listeria rocourtiae]MBC1434080.1 hypothetical protein [Listeria rocourtiae]MBC1603605.1 hypothetical protein [Listeria rocourtiae]TDR53961.1 hypothetical protein DFP96_10357 [Listeria rocourtiae]
MKESDIIFPTIVRQFLKNGIRILSEDEEYTVQKFLEQAYVEQPCNEEVVYALIKFYNAKQAFEEAKEVGQAFLMMDGCNKSILGELSATYLAVNEMDTYFSLVKQHLEKEAQLNDFETNGMQEESNVIPFPKKIKPRRSITNFFEWGTSEQLEFLQQARFHDVEPYVESFALFLKDATTSPYVKSMVFELLQEKKVDKSFLVKKVGMEEQVNPSDTSLLGDGAFIKELIEKLVCRWEHSNPSLLEQLQAIVQQHLFLMYPFQFPITDTELWSEAYSKWLSQMYGEFWRDNPDINQQELIEAIKFIEKIEQAQQNYLL